MGNSTISSNEEMKKLSSSIATICNTVNKLKRDMDLLNKTDDTNSDTSSVTRARLDSSMAGSNPNESSPDVSEEIDTFLDNCQQEAPTDLETDWADISDYFEDDPEIGDAIPEELVKLTNSVLRGKPKTDKTQLMKQKHKRPKNGDNLQVPKVDMT